VFSAPALKAFGNGSQDRSDQRSERARRPDDAYAGHEGERLP